MDVLACVLSVIAIAISATEYVHQKRNLTVALAELEKKVPYLIRESNKRKG